MIRMVKFQSNKFVWSMELQMKVVLVMREFSLRTKQIFSSVFIKWNGTFKKKINPITALIEKFKI